MLSHPLFVTAVAGVFGVLLTRGWQDRQASNSLKQNLLSQLATSTATALGHAQSLAKDLPKAAGGDKGDRVVTVYNELRDSWATQRAAIRSQMVVFFPGLYTCWYSFDTAVNDYLSLSPSRKPGALANQKERATALMNYVNSDFAKSYVSPGSGNLEVNDTCKPLSTLPPVLQSRFAHLKASTNWGKLASLTTTPGFSDAYAIVGEELGIDMERIINTVVRTPAKGFGGLGL